MPTRHQNQRRSALDPQRLAPRAPAAIASEPLRLPLDRATPQAIQQLQRTLGNRTVGALLQRVIIDQWDNYQLKWLKQEQLRRNQGGRVKPKGNKYERLTLDELKQLITYHTHSKLTFTAAQPQMAQQPSPQVIDLTETEDPIVSSDEEDQKEVNLNKQEQENMQVVEPQQQAANKAPELHPLEYLSIFANLTFEPNQVARFFLRKGDQVIGLSQKYTYSIDSHAEEKMFGDLGEAIQKVQPDAVYVFSLYSPCSNYTAYGHSAVHNCSGTLADLPKLFSGVQCFLGYSLIWQGQDNTPQEHQKQVFAQSLKGLEQLKSAGWQMQKL